MPRKVPPGVAFPISAAFRIATRPIALAARLIVFVVTRTIALAIGLLSFTATSAVPRIVRLVAFVVTKPVVLIAGLVAFLATVAAPRIVGSLLSILGKQVSLVAGYLLFVADLIIYVMVRVQGGGRNIRPTRRRPFAAGQKEDLFRSQDGRCMYCGAIRDIREFQIDHMMPVVRGGPHEQDNFQLLCGPCNNRKRDYTDEEFRQRFGELLGTGGGGRDARQPPRQQIPLDRFEEVSRQSPVPQSLQDFHRTKFSPQLRKVAFGCIGIGLVALAAWAALAVIDGGRPSLDTAQEEWRAFGAGLAGYAAASLALLWRAYVIGKEKLDR